MDQVNGEISVYLRFLLVNCQTIRYICCSIDLNENQMCLNDGAEAEEKDLVVLSFLNQKSKLAFYENNNETWITDTAGLVERYIGKETACYNLIKNFSFSIQPENPQFVDEVYLKGIVDRQNQASHMIDIFIDFIGQNGILKTDSEQRTLSPEKASPQKHWPFILILMIAIFSLCIWIGFTYR